MPCSLVALRSASLEREKRTFSVTTKEFDQFGALNKCNLALLCLDIMGVKILECLPFLGCRILWKLPVFFKTFEKWCHGFRSPQLLQRAKLLKCSAFWACFFVGLFGGFFETVAGTAHLWLVVVKRYFLSSWCTLEIPAPLQIQEKNCTEQFSSAILLSVWLLRSSLSHRATHAIFFGGLCSSFYSAFAIPNVVTTFS